MVRKILKEVRFMSWEQVYEQWIDSDKLDEKMRKELQDLGKDRELKKDAFYKQLEFGTAGMRGV
jgi:phosphoglucomutase